MRRNDQTINIFTRKVINGNLITITYHGSNSWIMLSKRITANRRDENPDSQANTNTANVIRLLHPAVLLFITDLDDFIVSILVPQFAVCRDSPKFYLFDTDRTVKCTILLKNIRKTLVLSDYWQSPRIISIIFLCCTTNFTIMTRRPAEVFSLICTPGPAIYNTNGPM